MDWLLINFILSEDVLAPHFEDESGSFRILFMCMRNHEGLVIEIGPKGEVIACLLPNLFKKYSA